MTYKEVLEYLLEQLPMYQRLGKAAYKGDLGNALELDQHFGHPHRKFRTIHVGGTNGKGSVSHLLASILQSAGYKTGLYTSPHLLDFRERVRVNGQKIPGQAVVDFVEQSSTVLEKVKPSFFEMTMALAFDYLAAEQVDVAVVEVGLGGRLDSTNIITPDLSIITNIGLDHTMFLGDTLEAIAGEKAGIIKPGVPVVVGRHQPETADVFIKKAGVEKASLTFAEDVYEFSEVITKSDLQLLTVATSRVTETFKLPLLGGYQKENLVTALVAVGRLRESGYGISDEAIHHGVENVVIQTGLTGRWQKISDSPLTICDTAHNADGIGQIVTQLRASGCNEMHVVWGMVNDKDIDGILALLPAEGRYYFTGMSVSRGVAPEELLAAARKAGLKGDAYPGVQTAIRAAKKNATDNDLIFIGGSTFVVAEALEN